MNIEWWVPEGWSTPGDDVVEKALSVCRGALSEDDQYPASTRLTDYYRPEGDYAGVSFAEMEPTGVDDIGIAYLHALTMLNVRVGPRATRRLLPGGQQLGAYRDNVRACLSHVAMTDRIEDAGPELLTRMSDLFLAVLDAMKDQEQIDPVGHRFEAVLPQTARDLSGARQRGLRAARAHWQRASAG